MRRSRRSDSDAPGLTGTAGAIVERKRRSGSRRLRRPPPPRSVKGLQRAYTSDLVKVVSAMGEAVIQNLRPVLAAVISEAGPKKADARADSWVDDVKRGMQFARLQFFRQYSPDEVAGIARKQGRRIDAANAADFDRQFAAVLGVKIPRSEAWLGERMQGFVAENVSMITTLEESHFGKIEQLVMREAQAGTLGRSLTEAVQDLIDSIEEVDGSTEARAALIARDQTSKFNGSLTQARQLEVGVNKYVWSTSMDERVRESHREKEGNVYPWDDPPADTGHPTVDINCRCVALPYFDESQAE